MFTTTLQSFRQLLDTRWARYHLAVFWLAILAIFYLATTAIEHQVQATFNDKINHLAAFGTLSLLAHIAYASTPKVKWATGLLGYGLLIEVVQYFLPHREFSLLDLAADLAGIALYLVIFYPLFERLLVNRHLSTSAS